jgi:hypothetical protein
MCPHHIANFDHCAIWKLLLLDKLDDAGHAVVLEPLQSKGTKVVVARERTRLVSWRHLDPGFRQCFHETSLGIRTCDVGF